MNVDVLKIFKITNKSEFLLSSDKILMLVTFISRYLKAYIISKRKATNLVLLLNTFAT
jgi:hypothetical protein